MAITLQYFVQDALEVLWNGMHHALISQYRTARKLGSRDRHALLD